jgi:hypothetical protein
MYNLWESNDMDEEGQRRVLQQTNPKKKKRMREDHFLDMP